MNATDFYAVTYDGAVYCTDCLPEGVDIDSDIDSEVSPIFADSEWDSYPVCDVCHAEHDYVCLTPDGIRAARERRAGPLASMLDAKGNLPAFAWPGGYQIIYLDKDNSVLCPECANRALAHDSTDNPPVSHGPYHEGPPLACDECGSEMESDYGDPDATDSEKE